MGNSRAYSILVLIMVIWGINVPAVKYLTTNASPITMTSIRIFLAAITVYVILYFLGILRKLSKKEWGIVVAGSILNVVIHHASIAVGMRMTTSTNASLIMGSGPIITAVVGTLLLKNLPTLIQWCGFIVGMMGVSFAVIYTGGAASSMSWGDLLILLAIVTQVFSFVIIAKVAKTIDPRLLTANMFLVGSVMLVITSLILEPGGYQSLPFHNKTFWLLIILSGCVASALGHMFYNDAIPKVGTAKASIFINLNTIVALFSSSLFIGDPLTIGHFVGLIFIIVGVILGSGALEHFIRYRKAKNFTDIT